MTAVELGNDWVAVWRPTALGDRWLTAYEQQDGRFRLREDAPHPRLVLPLALVAWGAGIATTIPGAAAWVVSRSLADVLAATPDGASLPVPCPGAGRCEASVVNGYIQRGGGDPLEAVARAFTHRGACAAYGRAPYAPDWTDRWFRHLDQSVALGALGTVDRLKRSEQPARIGRVLAGVPRSEADLNLLFHDRESSIRGGAGWARYMSLNKTGSVSVPCGVCGHQMYGACRSCAAYVQGPTPRDTAVDRLAVALGAR